MVECIQVYKDSWLRSMFNSLHCLLQQSAKDKLLALRFGYSSNELCSQNPSDTKGAQINERNADPRPECMVIK